MTVNLWKELVMPQSLLSVTGIAPTSSMQDFWSRGLCNQKTTRWSSFLCITWINCLYLICCPFNFVSWTNFARCFIYSGGNTRTHPQFHDQFFLGFLDTRVSKGTSLPIPRQRRLLLSDSSPKKRKLHGALASVLLALSNLCGCGEVEATEHFLFICPIFHVQRIPVENYCLSYIKTWLPPLHRLTCDEATI